MVTNCLSEEGGMAESGAPETGGDNREVSGLSSPLCMQGLEADCAWTLASSEARPSQTFLTLLTSSAPRNDLYYLTGQDPRSQLT